MVAPLKVGIAGLGTVGAEVVRLIEEQSRTLSERSGRGVRVVAVTARSKAKKRSLDLRGIEWAKSPLALGQRPRLRFDEADDFGANGAEPRDTHFQGCDHE